MRGTITGKDVFLHWLTIVRLWGLATFLACAWAAITRRSSTFLGVLYASSLAGSDLPRRSPPVAAPRWRPSR